MTTIPGVMRHACFGDESDSTRMYVVPEHELVIELRQDSGKTSVVAKFKGRAVSIPHGTSIVFHTLAAVNMNGAHVVDDKPKAPPGATILGMNPKGVA